MASKLRLIATVVSILIIIYFCMFVLLFKTGQTTESPDNDKLNHEASLRRDRIESYTDHVIQRNYRSISDNNGYEKNKRVEVNSEEFGAGDHQNVKEKVTKPKSNQDNLNKNGNEIKYGKSMEKNRTVKRLPGHDTQQQYRPTEGSDIICNNNTKEKLPVIYVITPTYKRLNQIPELTRLSNTLKNVPSIHWIVVEEGEKILSEVNNLLSTSGIHFTYISAKPYKNVSSSLKGIHQRNKAIFWLRKNIDLSKNGVVYFADDDNTYTLKLFDEMRYTRKVSVWPVGFVSGRKYQTPVVKNGKIVKFDAWNAEHRKFAVDMAGFALNTKLFHYNPHLYFWKTFKIGLQETSFLEICCRLKDLEPKANGCTKVLVWHTKAKDPIIKHTSYNDTDPSPVIERKVETKKIEYEEIQTSN